MTSCTSRAPPRGPSQGLPACLPAPPAPTRPPLCLPACLSVGAGPASLPPSLPHLVGLFVCLVLQRRHAALQLLVLVLQGPGFLHLQAGSTYQDIINEREEDHQSPPSIHAIIHGCSQDESRAGMRPLRSIDRWPTGPRWLTSWNRSRRQQSRCCVMSASDERSCSTHTYTPHPHPRQAGSSSISSMSVRQSVSSPRPLARAPPPAIIIRRRSARQPRAAACCPAARLAVTLAASCAVLSSSACLMAAI